MRGLRDIFFGEPKNTPGNQPHRGIDYTSVPPADGLHANGVKEMQDAYEAFDALVQGVRRAAVSTDALTSSARQEIERRNVLHRKAIEKRRKRKRGGPK